MQFDAIPVALGIEGFRVIATDEREDVVEVAVETMIPAACCSHCGHADGRAKERKPLWIRDTPIRPGKQTWLIWHKRRFTCGRCQRTFTETHSEIPPRATHTLRFDRYLAGRAVETPYAQVADEEGVTFYRIDKAACRAATAMLGAKGFGNPTRLCIDEQSHRRGHVYNTVFSDPDRRRVLELIETRNQRPVQDFLASLPEATRRSIREVVIDMHDPYRRAIENALPGAQIVADRFHVERFIANALDKVRRQLQQSVRIKAKRQRSNPERQLLFRSRHKLLRGKRRLTIRDLDSLAVIFGAYPELQQAWELRWRFRLIYEAPDVAEGRRRLRDWCTEAEESGLVPFVETVAVLRSWEDKVLAYFTSGLTNAYAEGITNKIKVIKRRGYGFRNFGNFRRRVLVQCA